MVDEPDQQQDDNFFLEDEGMLAADPAENDGNEGPRPGFKEIWRSNPSLKIFAIVAGIGFLLISYIVFGAGGEEEDKNQVSIVGASKGVSQPPGTAELPPAYEEAVRKATEKRIEEAMQTGGSALPTPIARPAERIEAPVQIEEKDPLSEWRREAEARRAERKKEDEAKAPAATAPVAPPALPVAPLVTQATQQVVAAAPAPPPPPPLPTNPTPEQVQAYAGQMQGQISTIMGTQVPKESVLIKLGTEQKAATEQAAAKQQAISAQQRASSANGTNQTAKSPPIITVGTIAYAQTLTEANSDVPGPILAEIASGPLVGGRAIGSFSVAEDKLVLQFNRVVKDGKDYSIQTYAIDPATTLTAMSTDVNRHYLTRVFIPAAATFIRSYAQAVSQQDTTVVVTNGTVVSESQNKLNPKEQLFQALNQAGQRASQVIDEDSERPITVKVAMGTRIGLLFVENVYSPEVQAQITQQQQAQQQSQWGQALMNATPAGQMYNAANNVWGSQQQNVFQPQGGNPMPMQQPTGQNQMPPSGQPSVQQMIQQQPR
jgi:intracellular multiplication protein IcmE